MDAFRDQHDLNELVRYRLGMNPATIFGSDDTLGEAADHLIAWAESEDQVGKLLLAACEKRPRNVLLAEATREIKPELPPGSLTIDPTPVVEGMKALQRLMSDPTVRKAVGDARDALHGIGGQLVLVRDYKAAHDLLHDLQLQCHDALILELPRFPEDTDACDNVESLLYVFRRLHQGLHDLIKRNVIPKSELKWVTECLDPAERDWDLGYRMRDRTLIAKAEGLVRNVLSFRPSKINVLLDSAAKDMLPTFVSALEGITAGLPGREDEDELRFKAGVDRLQSMATVLEQLIDLHDDWQQIENELRALTNFVTRHGDPVSWVELQWPGLKELLLAPTLVDQQGHSGQYLRRLCDRLEEAINTRDPTRVRNRFRELRCEGKNLFYDVDKRLKAQCDELPSVASELQPLLAQL